MKLSIIIPAYNEEKTIKVVLDRLSIVDFGIDYEVIIVDDGSTDDTKVILQALNKQEKNNYKIIFQGRNCGKGAALLRGFSEADGDIIAIQDADLEYDPHDLPKLIEPIFLGKTEIVYGARFLTQHQPRYKLFFWGNRFLAFLLSLLYGRKINDPWTCYKVFKKSVLKDLNLYSNGFDLEIELTSKFLKRNYIILEIPISYQSRGYKDGKKIKWQDGLKAIIAILKYRFL